MKNKTKSIIKRISALVAVFVLVALSAVPCFALENELDRPVAYTTFGVPVYMYTLYSPYVTESGPESYVGYRSYRFGAMLDFTDYSYSVSTYDPIMNIINVTYDDDTDIYTVEGYKDRLEFDLGQTDVHYFDAHYELIVGNFLINPSEDDFTFDITLNKNCNIEFVFAYSVLDDVSGGEVKTYRSEHGNTGTRLSLDDIFVGLGITDVDVYVYALNIEITVNNIGDNINYSVEINENETFRVRNYTEIYTNTTGNIVYDEYNFLLPIADFYKGLGVNEYKQSFNDYTADYTSWLGTAVGGFLNMELFPYFSIGGILLICVSLGLVGYFLKVFMGG